MPRRQTSNMVAGALWGAAVLAGLLAVSLPTHAQPAPPASAPPAQVQQLLHLLQDPVVRSWID